MTEKFDITTIPYNPYREVDFKTWLDLDEIIEDTSPLIQEALPILARVYLLKDTFDLPKPLTLAQKTGLSLADLMYQYDSHVLPTEKEAEKVTKVVKYVLEKTLTLNKKEITDIVEELSN